MKIRSILYIIQAMKAYDHNKIERKWQNAWEKKKVFQAESNTKKQKFYSLIEFPYPSGDGLHVGHIRSNTAMDIISRKRRMEGFNVLYPIGWDAFGLPTENYAIKTGIHPIKVTKDNTDIFRRQLKAMGFSFDWSREINTTDPKYYKWTQWIFLQLFKKGLAYKAKMAINWCPKDKIGLANEEVIDGKCERCGTAVEPREKEQWMLAITKYADRLYKDLDLVDYLPQIKLGQRNWIGRSEGAEIEFRLNLPPTPSPREGEFRYHTTSPENWRLLHEEVLKMRKNPTPAEEILWKLLRKIHLTPTLSQGEGENTNSYRFRRQHIIDKFIVDFICLPKNLVVEVDGDIHDYQKEKDEERTQILQTLGFRILRFKNEEVLNNSSAVIEKINKELKALPLGEGVGEVIKVFTTRPDTIFGVTFLAVAPEVAKKLTGKDFGIKTDTDRENKEKIGVDTGFKAKNPANGELIPVFAVNYVSAEYGTGAIMGVPAHDERDFEFAKKYNLEIKYVIAQPEMQIVDPPKEGKPFIYRKAVECYVRNPLDDTFLLLDWKNAKWKTPITGGIEEGEDVIEAARREIYEETGYKNLKFIQELGAPIHAEFFHPGKNENRRADFYGLYFELENTDHDEVTEDEKKKHSMAWVPSNKVKFFITTSPAPFENIGKSNLSYGGQGTLIN